MGIATSGVRRRHVSGAYTPRRTRSAWSRAYARTVIRVSRSLGGSQGVVHRSMNVALAALAVLALLPVFVLLAVLVKLTSRGPVFYLQERVGLDRRTPGPGPHNHRRTRDLGGAPFTIYKFRTMRVDAERHSGAVWAQQQDPRVTPVGRVLRQYRLDELPQLLNVLRGEMNIVGPRPERPTIFAELREPHRRVPAAPAGQAGHHRAGPDQPPLRPLARRRAHQGAATTWSTSAARACAKTSASCSRPSPSSSSAAAAGEPTAPRPPSCCA